MDRRRIGGNERVEFAKRIFNLATVKLRDEDAIGLVDPADSTKVLNVPKG